MKVNGPNKNLKDLEVTITDEEGIVQFSVKLSDIQQELNDDPDFGDEPMVATTTDLLEAVTVELKSPYYCNVTAPNSPWSQLKKEDK